MPTLLPKKSIYFNDVNILPSLGKVESRKDIPKELYRIIVSPMLAVVGETFVKEAAILGLSVCTPRFISTEQKLRLWDIFIENRRNPLQTCFVSVGLNEKEQDLYIIRRHFLDSDGRRIFCRNILVDIANGYVPQIKERIKAIHGEEQFISRLMVGNIVTAQGIRYLSGLTEHCNELYIRVGIGNGKPCSSSDVAGINRGQITELFECYDERGIHSAFSNTKINLVSDGGISKSGFALKAFGAGADYVLMGSYFSHALEAETHINGDGTYFGCASEKQNKLAGLKKHAEGKEFKIDKNTLKPLDYLVGELWGGLSSGISYCGYKSLTELIGNGIFEEKSNSLPPKNRV